MSENESEKSKIKNFATERSLIAGLVKFPEALFEMESFLSEKDFFCSDFGKFYSLFRHLVIDKQVVKMDYGIILSTISNLKYKFAPQLNVSEFVNNLIDESKGAELKNLYILAKDVVLFSRRREIWECGNKMQKKMMEKNFGTMQEIVAATDEVYFDAIHNFTIENDMVKLGGALRETLNHRADNPVSHMGFSSGYSYWDSMIGNLRPDMLCAVSARDKVGKSMFALNIARHVAQNKKMPVLYMDSELSEQELSDRLVAHIAQVDISLIENGYWRSEKDTCRKVEHALGIVDALNIEYCSIRAGNINTVLSNCRRFLFKTVKRNPDGIFNPCLFIYDYLKLDYGSNLGDAWHLNLAKTVVNFKDFLGSTGATGILLSQNNRSGVTKLDTKNHKTFNMDTADVIGGTDEIVKTCSNTSLLRFKSPEEKLADGEETGDTLLIPISVRHGKGSEWLTLSEGQWVKNYVSFKRTPNKMTFTQTTTKELILKSKNIGQYLK